MSRPKKVSKFKKGLKWYVRFQNKDGERIKKSLQTKSEDIADEIIRDISYLLHDETIIVEHAKAYEIVIGELPDTPLGSKMVRQLNKYPEDTDDAYIMADMANKLSDLEDKYELLLRKYNESQEELNSLKQDKEIRMLSKYKDLPTFNEAFQEYKELIKHLDQGGALHTRLLDKLFTFHDCLERKIAELQPQHIYKFLTEKYSKGSDPSETWNRQRRLLFRFWKWLSVNYEIENIIQSVETKKQKPKDLMNWHTLEEVQEELKSVAVTVGEDKKETEHPKGIYWKAIISVMAFAGLSAHEVRGLRNEDFDGEFIIIRPHQERGTKSANRIRKVKVHETHLKPVLAEYLETKKESRFLFPSTTYGSEIWTTHTFSRNLNKHIKTPGMNALSLRRTFGSLLLRSGKTETEVAAAMGNTAVMVRKHYAKILGGEVDIDF